MWRPIIARKHRQNSWWQKCDEQFQEALKTGTFSPCSEGGGSAYFLVDTTHTPKWVVKPFDEDTLCLHNRKLKASPYRDSIHRVRSAIPLYETFQRELAAFEIAACIGIGDITPCVVLSVLQSDNFYDISESLPSDSREDFIQRMGGAIKEKLCSIQPFIPETIGIGEAVHEWFEAGMEKADTPFPLEQNSFEDANLFVWLTYDCDGHGSNFLLYLHSLNDKGKALYGLKKIDNGLCFPTVNKYLLNYLAYLPNAKLPLSTRLRKKIAGIHEGCVTYHLVQNGLHDSIAATLIRISVLKKLALRNEMTLDEINLRMELLAIPSGETLAISTTSREELERLAFRSTKP